MSFAVVLLSLFLSAHGFAATEITNVRHWAAPDHTRVVFDLSADPDYRFKSSDNTLTLNFSGTSLHPSLPAEKVIDKPVVRIGTEIKNNTSVIRCRPVADVGNFGRGKTMSRQK